MTIPGHCGSAHWFCSSTDPVLICYASFIFGGFIAPKCARDLFHPCIAWGCCNFRTCCYDYYSGLARQSRAPVNLFSTSSNFSDENWTKTHDSANFICRPLRKA